MSQTTPEAQLAALLVHELHVQILTLADLPDTEAVRRGLSHVLSAVWLLGKGETEAGMDALRSATMPAAPFAASETSLSPSEALASL